MTAIKDYQRDVVAGLALLSKAAIGLGYLTDSIPSRWLRCSLAASLIFDCALAVSKNFSGNAFLNKFEVRILNKITESFTTIAKWNDKSNAERISSLTCIISAAGIGMLNIAGDIAQASTLPVMFVAKKYLENCYRLDPHRISFPQSKVAKSFMAHRQVNQLLPQVFKIVNDPTEITGNLELAVKA